ncbi:MULTISPECIES: hybrid sensor histidine kinase/response regulator [Pseudanabaena]|uniref:hybrid sensor histidine kinase/response regulator n=1 Tax=Pseudanabaena TaxID=1152 RepID=UPI0024785E93|nr:MULTISPECIES: hybrid sensor histidine kinase/response regulator [Pseudanabaena]MEA5489927.1 hybrid sensor histidine kinase/response regulator [Pseudanabaena sp. CCNP1317]WGS70895.1 hybrid sensor histidine kinase/response regulator [Pseudanabaena galeata CCNP1313]
MTNISSILVVDDEPNNFDVIEALLSEYDYELHYAANGKSAIASLTAFQPDLILLDVMMPEMDGIEVCKWIKASELWQTVPIIMVTALSSKTDMANCLNAGADDFISKPINSIELRARVHSMLRIKQQYDNIQTLSHIQANTINILESTLNELRGTLASRMSHELNTPLNGIIGTIAMLKEDIESMDIAEIHEMLGWADESARRLESLTKKFLIYLELEVSPSRQESFKVAHTKFSRDMIESSLKSYVKDLKRSDDLQFDFEEAEIALSDRYLLTILHELVDNAVKFSTAGKMIKISSQVAENMFNLSVKDLGRGMTNEQINRIDAFVQFERKNYEQQGIGLGLRVVKKIVELAGGNFSITSIYQQETTVYISLPLYPKL